MSDPKFVGGSEAARRLKTLGNEFALVKNPSYVRPPFEFYPLAPKSLRPLPRLVGVVKDMDGTTTTTENLCLHSLETVVRRITGRPSQKTWPGLNREKDYPNIIGNSTTRHVEYLIQAYRKEIRHAAFVRSALEAALWTRIEGKDDRRKSEVKTNLDALGWSAVLNEDPVWRTLLSKKNFDPQKESKKLDGLARRFERRLKLETFNEIVRMAIEIYYYRYHEILKAIHRGEGEALSKELLGGQRLIEPMPGVAIFLSLVKGWLGKDAAKLFEILKSELRHSVRLPPDDVCRRRLADLGERFEREPLKIAVVTSSIRYEADVVLNEVFSVIREQVKKWPVKRELAIRFSGPLEYYDAFITASDSSEIRLKPHRDLYSIALHALGIKPEDFDKVVGFEDSESGTIAIRAAGIGLCVAVPFADTSGHNLKAAAFVQPAGLPQVLLQKNLFLKTPPTSPKRA